MAGEILPLLVAAGTVGILHMSAPDHWATLIVLGRVSNWSRSHLVQVGVATAVGHAALSILLGFAIVGLGLIFTQQISLYVTQATGIIMVVGGLLYGFRALRSAEDVDYERQARDRLSRSSGGSGARFRYFAVLGAALSPDLSILPVFLLAIPFGLPLAIDAAIVFAAASILVLPAFLLIGTTSLGKALEKVPPKYNDAMVGFVIAAVGAYILLVG